MSDLISRKALITEIEINMADICNSDVREGMEFAIELINSIPTAFDKEKVIEELEDYLFEKYCVEGDEKIAEIVEKGGIE